MSDEQDLADAVEAAMIESPTVLAAARAIDPGAWMPLPPGVIEELRPSYRALSVVQARRALAAIEMTAAAELVEHKERIRELEAEVADLTTRLRRAEGMFRDLKRKLAGVDDA